jgi:hypothetical protein
MEREKADAENAGAVNTVNMERGSHGVRNVEALNIVNYMEDVNHDVKNVVVVSIANYMAEGNHNVKNVKILLSHPLVTLIML